MTKKYGLHMLVTTDPAVKEHMANILKQVEGKEKYIRTGFNMKQGKKFGSKGGVD